MPTPSRGHGTHVSRGGADWHLASREIEKDSRPVSGRRRPAERAERLIKESEYLPYPNVGCAARFTIYRPQRPRVKYRGQQEGDKRISQALQAFLQ